MVKVLQGASGFLFLGGDDSNDILAQHTGRTQLGQKLTQIRYCHSSRADFFRRNLNASYLHMLVPNKETVARTLMPEDVIYEEFGISPIRQYLQIFPAASEETLFKPDLFCNYLSQKLYYKTDTHWTFRGAKKYLEEALYKLGYIGRLNALKDMALRIDLLPFVGDLARHIQLPGEIQEHIIPENSKAILKFFNGIETEGRVFHFVNENANGRLLLLMDSTGSWMLNMAAELFAETLAVHTADIDISIVMSFKPDLILFVQAERFFPRVPRDNSEWREIIIANETRKKATVSGYQYMVNQGWIT